MYPDTTSLQLALFDSFLLRFDTMHDGITNQLKQRLGKRFTNVTVNLGHLTSNGKGNRFPKGVCQAACLKLDTRHQVFQPNQPYLDNVSLDIMSDRGLLVPNLVKSSESRAKVFAGGRSISDYFTKLP